MQNSSQAGESTPSSDMIIPGDNRPLIPPRTLVLCFDGTGNQFDAVVRGTNSAVSLCVARLLRTTTRRTRILCSFALPWKSATRTSRWFTTRFVRPDLTLKSLLETSSPQSGVGTIATPQVATPVRVAFQKYLNMAVANHLDAHIMGTSCSFMRVLFELTHRSLQVATNS